MPRDWQEYPSFFPERKHTWPKTIQEFFQGCTDGWWLYSIGDRYGAWCAAREGRWVVMTAELGRGEDTTWHEHEAFDDLRDAQEYLEVLWILEGKL